MESFAYYLGRASLFLLGLCVVVFNLSYAGSVLMDIWGWFLVPAGMTPLLNKWHAIGILLIASYPLIHISIAQNEIKDAVIPKDDSDWLFKMWKRLAVSFTLTTVLWGIGALWHWLMTTNPF